MVVMRIALVIALFSFPVYAQTLSLEEISRRAVERSEAIQAELKLLESRSWEARGANRWENPEVHLQVGTLRSERQSDLTAEASFLQPLPWFGKRTGLRRQAEARQAIAGASLEEARRLVQHEALITAFHLAALNEVSRHSIERRKHYELIREYFKHHPQASPSQRIDAAMIENELRLLEKGMLELQQERESAARHLAFYLGSQGPVTPQVVWQDPAPPPSKEPLREKLFAQNPQWLRRQKMMESAEAGVSLARLEALGDIGIGGGYRYEDVQPSNRFIWGTLSLALPFWNRGQHTVPAARAAVAAERLQIDSLRRALERDFEEAYAQAETTFHILERFPMSLVKRSEDMFRDAEREFLKGRISSAAFLQTDSQVHETLDTIFETHVIYLEKISALHRLVGEPLTWTPGK